jgi:nondiscriminating aspartyl-tRNA synthetase
MEVPLDMERVLSSELRSHVRTRVRLAGWLHHRRRLSRLAFVLVRDRAGLAQVVVENPASLEQVDRLLPETVLEVEGWVEASEQAPAGVEVRDPVFRILAGPVEAPPIELRRPLLKEQLPTVLDNAAVALRHPRERAKFRITAASVGGYRAALDGLGFTEVQTPKLVGAASESGANLFTIDYFGRPAYLAQSPQLYKQILVGAFERVYEVGPVFRAEPHDTARHLAEYVSLDAEVGFIEDHRTVMAVAREAVAGMIEGVTVRAGESAALLGAELPAVPAEIPAIHFSDTGVHDLDLAPADERRLGEWAKREHGSDFVFVVGYPIAKRPFYTHPDPDRPEFSRGFDLLFRGTEIITGGQRLHRYEDYVAALAERDEDPDAYAGYLDAFRYGMPPHGGFAIGLERWTAQLVGASNIRETTLFPRDLHRLFP